MENKEQYTNIENAIHSFIMSVKDENKSNLITREMLYNEITTRVDLEQKEDVFDIINEIFNNKTEITILELMNNFMLKEQCHSQNNEHHEENVSKQLGNGSAHKVNISELNLLDKDIPRELINIHKPFENDKQDRYDITNNGKLLSNNYNKYNNYENAEIEYETLIKPSNNFGNLYCDDGNDDMNAELDVNVNENDNNDNIEQDIASQHHDNINQSDDNGIEGYNEEQIVYPINKKKNTFLYPGDDDATPQSLNQSGGKERKCRREGDFFMNMYQSVSYNKKKFHFISDKINKLYDSKYNDKQQYYPMSLKHMGKTTQHNNLYLNTPLTSMLQYKTVKQPKTQQHSYKKLSVERDKLFNEVLSNAKKESAFISQRSNNNNNSKYNTNYMTIKQSEIKQNDLNEIEGRIIDLLARNRNVNINERSIELKIAEQLKEMSGNVDQEEDDNYGIDDQVHLLNMNTKQQ